MPDRGERPVRFQHQIGVHNNPHREARSNGQRWLDAQVALRDLLPRLIGRVLRAVARRNHDIAVDRAVVRRRQFGTHPQQGRERGARQQFVPNASSRHLPALRNGGINTGSCRVRSKRCRGESAASRPAVPGAAQMRPGCHSAPAAREPWGIRSCWPVAVSYTDSVTVAMTCPWQIRIDAG